MSKILELRRLFLVLESDDGSLTRKQKIEEIKRARFDKLISPDDAIELAVDYSTEWQVSDFMNRKGAR